MPDLYPEIEPYVQGMLEVTGGDLVYWEVCGNPRGKPAVVLYGGPGSGCTPWHRRLFDPAAYRVVLFDQRGCGRSRPHASSPETELSGNTTGNLIADIERLRVHLNVERWLVLGGSWGSTLALAHAERSPTRVTELILFGVTTGRCEEFDWQDSDAAIRERAALAWCSWESATPDWPPVSGLAARFRDPSFAMAYARLVTHYVRHNAWLGDGSVLRDVDRLAGIPGVLVNGRCDFQAPPATAWKLHRLWPHSELVVVNDAGHAASNPGITEELIRATDHFARVTFAAGAGCVAG